MDFNGISSATMTAIAGNSTRNGDAVAISVLKKAMDAQASQAQQMIAAVPKSAPDADSLVGQNIDVRA